MKKNLIIEMEEDCINCPELDLETHTIYGTSVDGKRTFLKVHRCSNIDFCTSIRKNWEENQVKRAINDIFGVDKSKEK